MAFAKKMGEEDGRSERAKDIANKRAEVAREKKEERELNATLKIGQPSTLLAKVKKSPKA